jgi:hypothetical protein
MSSKSTLLKVVISGSFKTATKEIIGFDNVIGYIPPLDYEKAEQMVRRRYARIWISQERKKERDGTLTDEPKYKHIQRIREVFIDSIDDVEKDDPNYGKQLSYVGKDIMEMNFEELQDLAAAKDLIQVPLYKVGSPVNARRVAFVEYANKVLGWTESVENPRTKEMEDVPLDWRRGGFKPSNYPQIVVDGKIRRDANGAVDVERSLEIEALVEKHDKVAPPSTGNGRLSIDQLRAIATSKNIHYTEGTSYTALYNKLYPQAKRA